MQKTYLSGELIREIRKRKGLRQAYILGNDAELANSSVTISRIENLRQNPTKNTLTTLLSVVDMPYEQFFCPYMEDQAAEAFILRQQARYYLDRADGDEQVQATAQELIRRLESSLDFDSIVNKQLWISLKTRLDVIKGDAGNETLRLINEGLRLTYKEFDEDSFDGDVLIFYECDLLLNLVRYRADRGDLDDAITILTCVLNGYSKQPVSEQYKDQTLSIIHNTLTDLFLRKGDYTAALDSSERAMDVAVRESKQSQLAHSIYLRAVALFRAKDRTDLSLEVMDDGQRHSAAEKSEALLRQAYFAFANLRMEAMQKRVAKTAQSLFGTVFDTYGIETLVYDAPDNIQSYEYGSSLSVNDIGKLIRQFRLFAGLKPADIYRGICSRSFYSRLETGQRSGVSIFLLEALFERLGRDPDLYLNSFSSVSEFKEKGLRDLYENQLSMGNVDGAEETLKNLVDIADHSDGLRLQWLLFAKAIMRDVRREVDEEHLRLLNEAIRVTIPDYREDRISSLRLTHYESCIINAIAKNYTVIDQNAIADQLQQLDSGDWPENTEWLARSVSVYERLRESIRKSYIDESTKVRFYNTLVYNLALKLDNMRRHEEALVYADECELLSRRYGVFSMLNSIVNVKAIILSNLERDDDAIPYAAMAYYSGSLTNSEKTMDVTMEFAEYLGISFTGELGFVSHLTGKNA